MMADVHGSIPVFSFVISKPITDYRLLGILTTRLQKEGWVWFRDFRYSEDAKDILFEIYNEKLVNVVKELIVEYNI